MKILKAKRGISTIIAVLLMIVIAVAAAVITYVWIIAYLGGTMGGIEEEGQRANISIDTVANTSTTQIQIVVRNIGDVEATVDKVYVDGVSASFTGTATIGLESSRTLTATKPSGSWSAGTQYTVKVVCTDGASATYAWTCPS